MKTEWGVRYQRRDKDTWTSLLQPWPTLREATAQYLRLEAAPAGLYRRVRIVRRQVGPWRLA